MEKISLFLQLIVRFFTVQGLKLTYSWNSKEIFAVCHKISDQEGVRIITTWLSVRDYARLNKAGLPREYAQEVYWIRIPLKNPKAERSTA